MKMKYLTLTLCLVVCGQTMAQNDLSSLVKKAKNMIDSMSVKKVDRRYIDVPEKPWHIIVRGNVNQSIVNMRTVGTMAGMDYSAKPHLKTEPSRYLGLWAGYRGLGIGFTKNVGGDKGSYFTVAANGRVYSANLRIHSFENHSPNFDLNSDLIPEDDKDEWGKVNLTSPIKVRTVIADAFYLFNGKHFSYSAAYSQSKIQKRSAGSLMAGAMYYQSTIDYADHSNGDLIYAMQGLGKVKLWQGSVGLGYAYN
ncbi:MAG: DUF4421 family protein [Prevotella sp.]|nr:DUF4421 family protein [Prevotella sp.]